MRIYLALILLGHTFALNVFAQDATVTKTTAPTAAVWDLQNLSRSNLSDDTVTALTQHIRVKAFNILPDYRWIERGRITEVLDEQKLQASGCTDQSCVVELGQLLGARKMVTGSLSKTSGVYNLTLSIIDIETGLIDKSASETCDSCDEGQLYQLAEKAVLTLSGKSSALIPQKQKAAHGYEGRSNLDVNYPGLGLRHFFSDKTAVEIRGQYATSGPSNRYTASVFGARLYRYTSSERHILRPYFCLEGDYIIFKGRYSRGNGAAAGVFGGIEYFLGNAISMQTDIGASYITIQNGDSGLTNSGLEYIGNFAVNIYLNK